MASTCRAANGLASPSACCVCFPTAPSVSARNSVQLSEVYCPTCSEVPIDSPACLTTITRQKPPEQIKTLLNVESEIEYSKNFNKKLVLKKSPAKSKCKDKDKSKVNQDEYEIACEAADETGEESGVDDGSVKIGIMTETDKKFMIRVNGKEETPCVPSVDADEPNDKTNKKSTASVLFLKKASNVKKSPKKPKCRLSMFRNKNKTPEATNVINNNEPTASAASSTNQKVETDDESDGNNNNGDDKVDCQVKYSTLPMVNKQKHKRTIAIPQRTTSDGTQIFYLCDLPKKLKKGFFNLSLLIFDCYCFYHATFSSNIFISLAELDDGQYNPLWTSRGFTQTFHFWKENRRQSSTPLNAFLTYISLPWFSIAKDLLDHREMPILTF